MICPLEPMMKLQDELLKAMAKKITWWNAAEIIGLSEAHETTKGKTAAAVLLPLVFCCGMVVLIAGAVGFAIFQSAGGRWH